jgi:hypothetical protein
MVTKYERELCVAEWLDLYKVADERRRARTA